ncbi:MAG: COX15/CtaA family protein [Gammaproteobacteria bacterium]|nr:COX15/CtaA family protein [Gammaproteobacteria bacterium]
MGTISLVFASVWVVLLNYLWFQLRPAEFAHRLKQLTFFTAFLTLDLILFGVFTRLSDSGLGCPDWPACFSYATPIGAKSHIDEAFQAMPTGYVSPTKAWIEMIHRYLAMWVGVNIVSLWLFPKLKKYKMHPIPRQIMGWALAMVLLQGLLGAFTVTLKLYPLVVVLHLLGGLALLGILMHQTLWWGETQRIKPPRGAGWILTLLLLQISLGGWVSANYAFLACDEFPTCRAGQIIPPVNWSSALDLFRPLGQNNLGEPIGIETLTAIHLLHRGFALVVYVAIGVYAWNLYQKATSKLALWMFLLIHLQFLTGILNTFWSWPLLSALLHTLGATLLFVLFWRLTALSRGRHWV